MPLVHHQRLFEYLTWDALMLSPRVPSSMSIKRERDSPMDQMIQSMKQVYNKGDDFHRELVSRLRREIEYGDLNKGEQEFFQSFVQVLEERKLPSISQSQGNGPSININNGNNTINVNNYFARQA